MKVARRVVILAVIAVNSFQICTTWCRVAVNVIPMVRPKEIIHLLYRLNLKLKDYESIKINL